MHGLRLQTLDARHGARRELVAYRRLAQRMLQSRRCLACGCKQQHRLRTRFKNRLDDARRHEGFARARTARDHRESPRGAHTHRVQLRLVQPLRARGHKGLDSRIGLRRLAPACPLVCTRAQRHGHLDLLLTPAVQEQLAALQHQRRLDGVRRANCHASHRRMRTQIRKPVLRQRCFQHVVGTLLRGSCRHGSCKIKACVPLHPLVQAPRHRRLQLRRLRFKHAAQTLAEPRGGRLQLQLIDCAGRLRHARTPDLSGGKIASNACSNLRDGCHVHVPCEPLPGSIPRRNRYATPPITG